MLTAERMRAAAPKSTPRPSARLRSLEQGMAPTAVMPEMALVADERRVQRGRFAEHGSQQAGEREDGQHGGQLIGSRPSGRAPRPSPSP